MEDVLNIILLQLSVKDIVSCMFVNKLWNNCCLLNNIWTNLLTNDYDYLNVNMLKINSYETYKLYYKLSFIRKFTGGWCRLETLYTLKTYIHAHTNPEKLLSKIDALENLQTLEIYSLDNIVIPPEVSKLHNLKTLIFGGIHSISFCGIDFGLLCNLQSFVCTNCNLINIHTELGKLYNLEILNLENNKITTFTTELDNLTNLRELNLSLNKIVAIPPNINKLCNLETVNLALNKITTLPLELSELCNLNLLNLLHNDIRQIPIQIQNMPNLKIIGHIIL